MKMFTFVVFMVGVAIPMIAIPANKANLIDAITEETGIDREDVHNIVGVFLENIMQYLADGEKVSLTGFGVFGVREQSTRSGRNPQTGEVIQIPSSKRPYFKAGKVLIDAVNKEAVDED